MFLERWEKMKDFTKGVSQVLLSKASSSSDVSLRICNGKIQMTKANLSHMLE